MALLDEDKLQGNIIIILDLLRKQIQCCKIVSATFMCDSDNGVVWVTVNENGGITVYDAPGGSVITAPGTLSPLPSSGLCGA